MTLSDNKKIYIYFRHWNLVELHSLSAPVCDLLSVAFLLCLVFQWMWSVLGPQSTLSLLLEKTLVKGWPGPRPGASG